MTGKMGAGKEVMTGKMETGEEIMTGKMGTGKEVMTGKMRTGKEVMAGKMRTGEEVMAGKTGMGLRSAARVSGQRELYGYIRSELQKQRRTLLLWLHAGIPLLGIAVFLVYYSFAAWSEEGEVLGYIQVLTLVLPLVVSVICSMSVEQEEDGHFQTFLGTAVHKRNPLLAKWIVLSGMGFGSILLAVLGFVAGYRMMKGSRVFLLREYLILVMVMWLCSVNLYLIHLFLNLAFSKSISLSAGLAELVIAALFLTGLGEGRWQFWPCSWGSRWTGYLIQYWKGKQVLTAGSAVNSLVVGLGVTAVLWALFFLWFHCYEGRACRD